jgi:omega-amidase
MNKDEVRMSICQYKILDDKLKNIERARNQIDLVCKKNPNFVVLPECFVCHYDINIFEDNAEPIDNLFDPKKSPATCMLRDSSLKYPNVYIVGGSIIESEFIENMDYTLYFNTCLVFYNGNIIGKYRKINLYRINMKEHSYCEADVLTSGDKPVIFKTEFGKVGLGICYDIRFGKLAKYYQENDCKIIIYPGSFNRFTGPIHWLILQQVRALDNQLFIVSCSSVCNVGSSYESYGKSYIISPWGTIIKETILDNEESIEAILNLDEITTTRKNLPILV